MVVAETDTWSSATGESLRLMVDEFTRLQRETVHPAELRGAQDFMAGNFPLSIETSGAIAEQVLSRLFYGQNLSEIETARQGVAGDAGRHPAHRPAAASGPTSSRSSSWAMRRPS